MLALWGNLVDHRWSDSVAVLPRMLKVKVHVFSTELSVTARKYVPKISVASDSDIVHTTDYDNTTQRVSGITQYALYKFTTYLLTYDHSYVVDYICTACTSSTLLGYIYQRNGCPVFTSEQ